MGIRKLRMIVSMKLKQMNFQDLKRKIKKLQKSTILKVHPKRNYPKSKFDQVLKN